MSEAVGSGLDVLGDDEILARLRGLEADRRRIESDEAALLAQVERRGLAGVHGCKNSVDFLRYLLRIGPREAAGRLALSRAVAPRVSVTGVPVEPQHPHLATALEAGEISGRAAVTIANTVAKLPDSLVDGAGAAVERVLLDFARHHDPELLARHATDVLTRLDQDGALRVQELAAARRDLALTIRPNGTARLRGELTAELSEYLCTLLDSLAKPEPSEDGSPDPRSAAQRRHDALLTGIKLLLGSGRLPDTGGCTTTVVLTMDTDTYATGRGMCRTGHGVTIPAALAKTWLGPETRAILVLLSTTKGISAYSSVQRLFTEQQRLAMIARDKGCSYWGCDAPAAWTQAHHVPEWSQTHRTRVDEGALVCGGNHRSFERMGWTDQMINGQPHWVPPDWIDPNHTPRKSTLHDPP